MSELLGSRGLNRVATLDDINPANLKTRYLFGIEFLDAQGQPYPDDFYFYHLSRAVQELERETHVNIMRKTISDEKHDYDVRDYFQFAFLKLFEAPIVSVERVSLVYPTGVNIFTIPSEWVKMYPENGQIHLVPTTGTLSMVILGQGGTYLPLIYQGLGYLPHLFHVDYTAGLETGEIPLDVMDAIFKLACIELLRVAGDILYPPGTTSLSVGIDGLSQSQGHQNPPFRARLDSYKEDLYGDGRTNRGLLAKIKQFYHGMNMRVS